MRFIAGPANTTAKRFQTDFLSKEFAHAAGEKVCPSASSDVFSATSSIFT